MLETLRRVSKGWIMKTILGLLALTFVVFFGASDFGGGHGGGQGGRNTNAVVEVDDVDLSLNQIGREFNSQLQQISRASGQQIDVQSPIAATLLDQTVSTVIARTLYDVAARDLGVYASDNAVREAIRGIDAFRSADGTIDGALFGAYLRQTGLSEEQFVASARQDLQRSQFLGTLRAGVAAPGAMVEAIYKYRGEQRIAQIATISTVTVEGLSTPDESQLSKFYQENQQLFQAPEYRTATVASLSIDDLAADIVIEDDELAEIYAERIDAFRQGERREILQGIFLDQESANNAAAMVTGGRSFTDAVEEVTGIPPLSMGEIQRTELLDPDLAAAAFSIDAGMVTEPIETPLGWQLLSVASVLPEETQPLSEVADDLRRAIALEEARDEIFDVFNATEDGLAGGSTLEEVARDTGLKVQKLENFNAGGRLRTGDPLTFEPLPQLVNSVFSIGQGEIGEVIESQNGGFFVARADTITPPQVEPLDQVRDAVTTAWLDTERQNIATARATELAERARSGEALEALASEFGAKFETTTPFDRTGLGSTVSGTLITPIFAGKEGDIVQAPTQNGIGVARLVEVRKITGSDDLDREETRTQLAEGINRDIAQQLTDALTARYSIEVDRDAIAQSILPQ